MKYPFLKLAVTGGLLSLGLATPVWAQNSAVNNAILSLKAGPGSYDKAVSSINEAVVNEKTKNSAKAWFTRGDIYYTVLSPQTKALYAKSTASMQPGEAAQKAAESYRKALELDGPTGEFGKQVPERLRNIYGLSFNDAVNAYNDASKLEGDAKNAAYDRAIASYRLANQVTPKDTAVLFMAYAQSARQDYAGARDSYNQLLGMGYKTEAVYLQLLQLAQQKNDQAELRRVLDLALVTFPNNKTFMLQDLNMSMSGPNGGVGAIDKINKAILADPGNSNLYAVRGSIYDQQKKTDLALADYKKALELDPNNFDAQYNVGIFNYNQAATLYSKASQIKDINTYQTKGRPLEAQAKKYDEASLPYFEKALELKPDDQNTMFALRKVYARLNRAADAKRMDERMQAAKK